MKKLILLTIVQFIFMTTAHSQITKGNWMVGGSAGYSYTNASGTDNSSNNSNIYITPNIGYFFIDKIAGGMRLGYLRFNVKSTSNTAPPDNFTRLTNYSIGPYLRYYFLSIEKAYNILLEVSYQFGSEKQETDSYKNSWISNSKILFSAGPVIYFNNVVGLEFLLNYSSYGNSIQLKRSSQLGVGIGFQIHLQKDKP